MALIDGQVAAAVAADDRGLHFGDGLFETLAVRDGRPRFWKRHWRRLGAGCERLGLECPPEATARSEIERLAAGRERLVVKLILTRGSGPRGYRAPDAPRTRRILLASAWPEHPPAHAREGVALRLCRTRLGRNPALAGLKHCNRLEQVLARREWGEEAAEGLMLDTEGEVIEGTMSNVFLLAGGALRTPRLDRCGVAGVVRELILERAPELGLEAREERLELGDVRAADGLFLCNAVIGLWPVRRFGERAYPVPDAVARLRTLLDLEAA